MKYSVNLGEASDAALSDVFKDVESAETLSEDVSLEDLVTSELLLGAEHLEPLPYPELFVYAWPWWFL